MRRVDKIRIDFANEQCRFTLAIEIYQVLFFVEHSRSEDTFVNVQPFNVCFELGIQNVISGRFLPSYFTGMGVAFNLVCVVVVVWLWRWLCGCGGGCVCVVVVVVCVCWWLYVCVGGCVCVMVVVLE